METAFPAWGTLAPSILPHPRCSDRPTTYVGKGATFPCPTIHLSRPHDRHCG